MAAAFVLASATSGSLAAPPTPSSEGPWALGRLLVVAKAGLSSQSLDGIVREHGAKATRLGSSSIYIVELPPTASETATLARLQHNPNLRSVELDKRVAPTFAANDPYVGSAWHLPKISAPTAWDSSQGSGVTIAAIDTGVDGTHPDLAGSIVPGWNAYDNNSNSSDVHGHGTATAGAAAATMNNGVGVAGVAGRAKIMPIRISDPTGYAYYSTIANAITYAADHGARIANISYVDLLASSAIINAAQYMKGKNGLVFMAAGNAGGLQNYAPTTAAIPVSGTTSSDQLASWSSYGGYVSLSAPGQDIWTTNRGGGYGAWYGTSFASPVAAGVGALVMAAKPELSSTQVESILFSSAADLGSAGRDSVYGHGRVDAAKAVAAALSGMTPKDTSPPTASIVNPLGGSTVKGLVSVDVNAADDVGVAKVELRVNGVSYATDTVGPFSFSWNSSAIPDGLATLTAIAYDSAGNTGTSASISVNVSNAATVLTDSTPPSVQFTSPGSNTASATFNITGTSVTIATSASDNSGSSGITQSLYIDGVLKSTATGATLSYRWNTRKVSSGTHTLQLVARDSAGNSSTATLQGVK
jgi:subtilisin family serine protease